MKLNSVLATLCIRIGWACISEAASAQGGNATLSEQASDATNFTMPSTDCIKISAADANAEGVSFNLKNVCNKYVTVVHCFDGTKGLGGECNRMEPPGNGGSLGEWWGGHQGAGDLMPGASSRSIYIPSNRYIHVRACAMPAALDWISVQAAGDGGQYSCKILQRSNQPINPMRGSATVGQPQSPQTDSTPPVNVNAAQQANSSPTGAESSLFSGSWAGSERNIFGFSHALNIQLSVNGDVITGNWNGSQYSGTVSGAEAHGSISGGGAPNVTLKLIDSNTIDYSFGIFGGGTFHRIH